MAKKLQKQSRNSFNNGGNSCNNGQKAHKGFHADSTRLPSTNAGNRLKNAAYTQLRRTIFKKLSNGHAKVDERAVIHHHAINLNSKTRQKHDLEVGRADGDKFTSVKNHACKVYMHENHACKIYTHKTHFNQMKPENSSTADQKVPDQL